ncbi:helicase associated domain-containing protein [Streptomyces sp. NPDC086787]|uniref:helicase associated domain-containing protein n=1 Tax=Streptomyces sp. NPDC086787 TaxID=3365759 RepID=UPI00382741B8
MYGLFDALWRHPANPRQRRLTSYASINIETIADEDQEERQIRLGAWIGNQRSRAATLSPERIEQLSKVGMRWA